MNDNAVATASPTATTSYILSQGDYDQYTTAWQAFAGQAGGTPLTDAFFKPDSTRVQALSFPLGRIQELVSAVGVRQIRARFVLMPGSAGSQFNLVLFATDATGYRLSAYCLPDQYYTTSALEAKVLETKAPEDKLDEPIPQDLTSIWEGKWQNAAEITADMFTTYTAAPAHEPTVLEGYNFKIKDFVTMLFGAGPDISLGFGLHEYHSQKANSEADWTRTFGLVLQNPAAGNDARSVGAAQLDFDMAAPSPPNT
ncbi:hypothetical protein ACVWYF_002091 [Hymenobacter sp. UYAg731]